MSSRHYAIVAVERLVRVERYYETHAAAPLQPTTRHPARGTSTGRAAGRGRGAEGAAVERQRVAQVDRRAGW
jgi:hypothetical protein